MDRYQEQVRNATLETSTHWRNLKSELMTEIQEIGEIQYEMHRLGSKKHLVEKMASKMSKVKEIKTRAKHMKNNW